MTLTTNGPDCELGKLRSINTTDFGVGGWVRGGALRAWDGGVLRGINLLTKGRRLALSLTGKVTKSSRLIIMPTKLIQQSSPSQTSNRINETL